MEFSRPPGQRALEPGRFAGSAETDEGRTRRGKTRERWSQTTFSEHVVCRSQCVVTIPPLVLSATGDPTCEVPQEASLDVARAASDSVSDTSVLGVLFSFRLSEGGGQSARDHEPHTATPLHNHCDRESRQRPSTTLSMSSLRSRCAVADVHPSVVLPEDRGQQEIVEDSEPATVQTYYGVRTKGSREAISGRGRQSTSRSSRAQDWLSAS